jgi:hypothetical protein
VARLISNVTSARQLASLRCSSRLFWALISRIDRQMSTMIRLKAPSTAVTIAQRGNRHPVTSATTRSAHDSDTLWPFEAGDLDPQLAFS